MKYSSRWDLTSIPDPELWSEVGRRRGQASGGARPGAGRPRQYVACAKCGDRVTKTQARRGHGCER